MAFSFYDILNEADDDNAGAATDAPAADSGQKEAPVPKDDDFTIDTNPSEGNEATDSANDVADPATEDPNEGGGDAGAMSDGSEDPENEDDHDIFLSLPKEDQQMKIRELKRQYASLYSSLVDLAVRIDDIEVSDDNKRNISRVYMAVSDIKSYIADYIIYIFPNKSYIENDIALNNFLYILNSSTSILDKIISKEEKLREENDSNK